MSSAATAQAVSADILTNHLLYAAAALYLYDRVLSIQQEVNLIWCRPKTGIAVPILYSTMHIFTTLFLLFEIIPSPSNMSCKSTYTFVVVGTVVFCVLYCVWGAIASLRIYAINGRSWVLPTVILLVSLIPVAINIYGATTFVPVSTSTDNCMIVLTTSYATQNKLEITTRVSLFAVDVLVLGGTWHVTGGVVRLARGLQVPLRLTTLLLRDGTLYFCALLILNVTITVLWIQAIEFDNLSRVVLGDMLTTILLSRMFLNLREAALTPSPASHLSQMSDVHFSRVLGHLGNSLDDGLGIADNEFDNGGTTSDCGEEAMDQEVGMRLDR